MNNQPPALKVAIPRLGRSDHDRKSSPKNSARHRVQKACNNCRKRKVKCTGERPHCRNCVNHHMACTYSQARRDRLKEAIEQNSRLISLLKDLTVYVDDCGLEKIKELLDSLEDDNSSHASTVALETLGERSREGSASDGNRSAASDLLDKDLLQSHELRATNIFGQNSSNSFQTYPASSNVTFPSHTGNYFPWGEWGMSYFNHPIVTADVGAQFLAPLVEEQLAQTFGKVRPDQHL